MTARPVDLNQITLQKGSHGAPADTTGPIPDACLMEVVAWVAGEEWTDKPQCVSPVLAAFGRRLNDALPDDRRQALRPLIPQLIGTAGDGHDGTRSYMALDWLIRTYTPAWLDLAGLSAEAQQLRDRRRIVDLVTARLAGPVVRAARDQAAAARYAAEAAADAAEAAADAARATADAARATARYAAWAAAASAARDAAEAAAASAARDAAWDARDAARYAAEAAAVAAAEAAAQDAAEERLQPTVDQLQMSAIGLFTAMIAPRDAP